MPTTTITGKEKKGGESGNGIDQDATIMGELLVGETSKKKKHRRRYTPYKKLKKFCYPPLSSTSQVPLPDLSSLIRMIFWPFPIANTIIISRRLHPFFLLVF